MDLERISERIAFEAVVVNERSFIPFFYGLERQVDILILGEV